MRLFISWSDFTVHLVSTGNLSLTGFLIGTGIGLLIAILLHLIPFLKESFYPLLILSQNIPTIVLAPLLVIWFGFGMLPKSLSLLSFAFFPVTVAALDGFDKHQEI